MPDLLASRPGGPRWRSVCEGLGAAATELKLHEDTMRIRAVAAERTRDYKTLAAIEILRRLKRWMRTCLQAELCVPALTCGRDDVVEDCPTCTSATSGRWRTH